MKKNNICSWAASAMLRMAALTFASVCVVATAQAKTSYTTNDTLRVGMNAIDHVLQKPLGNPTFENKKAFDHLFMTAAAQGNLSGYNIYAGGGASFSIGDMVTPLYGWRINGDIGFNYNSKRLSKPAFLRLGADWVINLTNLDRGYRAHRNFELDAALGVELEKYRRNGINSKRYGVHGSLQARVFVGPSLYAFAEPELAITYGDEVPDIYYCGRLTPSLRLKVGLGYRLLTGKARQQGTTTFMRGGDSHLFFGGGAGVYGLMVRNSYTANAHMLSSIFAGKMFSATSGIRGNVSYGSLWDIPGQGKHLVTAGIGYVLNLSSLCSGYRPEQAMNVDLNLGPSVAYASSNKGKNYLGLEAALTIGFRLTDNWSLFLQPQAALYGNNFMSDVMHQKRRSALLSIQGGVRFNTGNFRYNHKDSKEIFDDTHRHSFVEFAAGWGWNSRRWIGNSFIARASFGKRFTPISSWRVSGEADAFSKQPHFMSIRLSADYMASISTAMAGYNPDRAFDLSALVGISAGIAKYVDPIKLIAGAHVGLHGAVRVTDDIDIIIEPQARISRKQGTGASRWTPELRVLAGVAYKIGKTSNENGNTRFSDGTHRYIGEFFGGPTFINGGFKGGSAAVNGGIELAVGRVFSPVSTGRIGINYDFAPNSDSERRMNLFAAHIDYLLSITNLMAEDAQRPFNAQLMVNAGLGKSDMADSSVGLTLGAGIRASYDINDDFVLSLEPQISFYQNRTAPYYGRSSHCFSVGRALIGIGYRF